MIDLDRLREARKFAAVNTAEVEYLAKTAEAVLVASSVWWCPYMMRGALSAETDQSGAEICPWNEAGSPKRHRNCRWVALVPITGEGR